MNTGTVSDRQIPRPSLIKISTKNLSKIGRLLPHITYSTPIQDSAHLLSGTPIKSQLLHYLKAPTVGLWRKLSTEELMLLNCGVDSWESLGLQGDPTSPFWRKSVLGVHWKDWCWSWNSNTLATSCEELTHWKRLWCWEGLEAGGEGDDRGWDGWRASLTWWTWVWVNSGSWWWTGRPGVLRFMGSQRVRHDWATELNWTDIDLYSSICENYIELWWEHQSSTLKAVFKYMAHIFNYSHSIHQIPGNCSNMKFHPLTNISLFSPTISLGEPRVYSVFEFDALNPCISEIIQYLSFSDLFQVV